MRKRTMLWTLVRDTFVQFLDNGGSLLGAALAFYVLLSVAPLLLILVSGAGLLFGRSVVSSQLEHALAAYVGQHTAHTVTSLVEGFRSTQAGTGATIFGGIVLLWSASRMFQQLQVALNQIWHVRTEFKVAKTHILVTLWKYVLALLLVLLAGGFFTCFVLISFTMNAVRMYVGDIVPGQAWLWQVSSLFISFLLLSTFFAIIYRYLADATVAWRDAWLGATVTAALCALAEYPLGYYLSHPAVTSGYGAAGSIVVLLLWVYYSAQVFLLGAQFTAVWAHAFGRGVVPDATATVVKDTPVAQSEQSNTSPQAQDKSSQSV